LVSLGEDCLRAVQLFGSDVKAYEKVIEEKILKDFDIIDVNMGCPVPKIFKNGEGCALMANIPLAKEIVKTVRESGKIISVKFRSGIDDNTLALPFALAMQEAGAHYLVLHARSKKQLYGGDADLGVIKKVARALDIPLYGNGGVDGREKYLEMLEKTGCYGVGVGRGAIGRPYIFSQMLSIDYKFDIFDALTFHIEKLMQYLPQKVVLNEIKKHAVFYIKGFRGAKRAAEKINLSKSLDELKDAAAEFLLATV
jgi:tRNA-dihydrouridine synthase B